MGWVEATLTYQRFVYGKHGVSKSLRRRVGRRLNSTFQNMVMLHMKLK